MLLPLPELDPELCAVPLYPQRGAGEQRCRGRLVSARRDLPVAGLFGSGLPHVSTLEGRRLALSN